MNVIVIGGGAAGVTVASEIRRRSKANITILERSKYLPYAACALPYIISGEITNIKKITSFDQKYFDDNKIDYKNHTRVTKLKIKEKKVVFEQHGFESELDYDKVVFATGSRAYVPLIEGILDTTFFTLQTIDDTQAIMERAKKGVDAVVIGGGLIGVEVANALKTRGLNTTIIESTHKLIGPMLDSDMSKLLEDYLTKQGIAVLKEQRIAKVAHNYVITDKTTVPFHLLIVACGVTPNIELATESGLKTDKGILVNRNMQTSNPDIYSCGDCTQIDEEDFMCAWIATNAVNQAKVVAENLTGNPTLMNDVLNTSVTKVGKIIIASTGQTQDYLSKKGKKTISATYHGDTKAEYHPQSKSIIVKLIAEQNGILKGAQIIGEEEVVGRINWVAWLIQKKKSVSDLCNAETAYNPAASPIFDPVTVAAEKLLRKLK